MKFIIILATFITTAHSACEDLWSKCNQYDKLSYCEHPYFLTHCRKHCGYCTPPGTCEDIYERCYKHDPDTFCIHSWWRTYCKKHCGLCDAPATNPPSGGTRIPPTKPSNTQPTGTQYPGQCGRPQVAQSRVVGGKTANPHSWPWQIGLHRHSRFICGGSIINSRWVVTAAHCIHRRSPKEFTVKLGDHDRRVNEGEQIIQVKRIISHPGYGRLNNDIALLELAKPAMFGKHVQPVCLPAQGAKPAVGSTCYITGWGKIKHPGGSHYILQQLKLKVQSKQDCIRMNSRTTMITDQMLCAANPDVSANQSGCHGDSGGPFVCQNGDGSWTLHGAVSWGSPRCDSKERYSVFARVAEFRNWMEQYINN